MGNLYIGTHPRANDDTLGAPSTSTIVDKGAPMIEASDPSMDQVSSVSDETYQKLLAEIQSRDKIIEALKAELLEAKQAAKAEAARKKDPAALRKERIATYEKYGPITSQSIDRALAPYK